MNPLQRRESASADGVGSIQESFPYFEPTPIRQLTDDPSSEGIF